MKTATLLAFTRVKRLTRWHIGEYMPPFGVVAELVDAADSKSASILEYGFESHLPHSNLLLRRFQPRRTARRNSDN